MIRMCVTGMFRTQSRQYCHTFVTIVPKRRRYQSYLVKIYISITSFSETEFCERCNNVDSLTWFIDFFSISYVLFEKESIIASFDYFMHKRQFAILLYMYILLT